MVNYNLTAMQGNATISGFIDNVNQFTNGTLIGMFMIALFITMLMIMKNWEFDKSILTSSFLCFAISLMLKMAGWINWMYVVFFFILMTSSGLYLYTIKN